MSNDFEITRALPTSIQRVSSTLKQSGTIGFWLQIVLGILAAVPFLFASAGLLTNQQRTQGSEFSIFCAFCGLIMLGMAIFFSIRYTRMARQLQSSDPALRPKRTETLRLIRIGLIVNLVGMLMAILGAAAIAGIVLLKSLTIPQGTLAYNPKQFVNSIDLLIIQANTNGIMAHFAGIVITLWLLDRITR